VKNKNSITPNYCKSKMSEDKIIREIHKIRTEIYEEVAGFSLEKKLGRINQGGMEFQKLVDKAKK
jgi:hypothetical protein